MIEYRIAANDDVGLLMRSRLEMLNVINDLPADYEYSDETRIRSSQDSGSH